MGSSSESSESRSPLSNSDFTIPRGDGNENVKNNNFARASHFSMHFFNVFTQLRREIE